MKYKNENNIDLNINLPNFGVNEMKVLNLKIILVWVPVKDIFNFVHSL